MNTEQINIECALVDGWTIELQAAHGYKAAIISHPEYGTCTGKEEQLKSMFDLLKHPLVYTTSYDAIIPLIQRQSNVMMYNIFLELGKLVACPIAEMMFEATPLQLATALLKALNRWKD